MQANVCATTPQKVLSKKTLENKKILLTLIVPKFSATPLSELKFIRDLNVTASLTSLSYTEPPVERH